MSKFDIPLGIGITQCPLCKSPTTHEEIRSGMDGMTVFGMTLKDIASALEYAQYHGWKRLNRTEPED